MGNRQTKEIEKQMRGMRIWIFRTTDVDSKVLKHLQENLAMVFCIFPTASTIPIAKVPSFAVDVRSFCHRCQTLCRACRNRYQRQSFRLAWLKYSHGGILGIEEPCSPDQNILRSFLWSPWKRLYAVFNIKVIYDSFYLFTGCSRTYKDSVGYLFEFKKLSVFG